MTPSRAPQLVADDTASKDVQRARSLQGPAPREARPLAARALAGPLLGALAVVAVMASLVVGDRSMAPGTVIDALLSTDMSIIDHQVVWGSRVPRTVAGVAVGAAIAVAGALVQALTRNPLADPGILGVNAGAAAAVAAGVSLLGIGSMQGQLWCAVIGALVATVAVLAIGAAGGSGADPIRLTLAGVAFAAVMAGLTTAITLLDVRAFDVMRTWSAGSLAVRGLGPTLQALPFIAIGLLCAAAAGRYLSSIALGDDLATTLGVPLLKARVLGILGITTACGAATAIAGPIGFVGLMVPHVVRWIVGPNQGWILVLSALAGPSLVLLADVLARVATPGGMPVGVVTAFLGAPVLIAMVRSREVSGL